MRTRLRATGPTALAFEYPRDLDDLREHMRREGDRETLEVGHDKLFLRDSRWWVRRGPYEDRPQGGWEVPQDAAFLATNDEIQAWADGWVLPGQVIVWSYSGRWSVYAGWDEVAAKYEAVSDEEET